MRLADGDALRRGHELESRSSAEKGQAQQLDAASSEALHPAAGRGSAHARLAQGHFCGFAGSLRKGLRHVDGEKDAQRHLSRTYFKISKQAIACSLVVWKIFLSQVWGSPALPEAKSHDQNILPTYVITYSLSFFTALIMADFRRDSAEYTPFSKGGDSLSARPSFQALANAKAAFQLLCYCSVACMFLHSFRFLFCLAAFTALPRSGGVLM
mmetsp:Transcript_71875/g.156532  ORF Transcript_71875/g.156532 Transcript_71875/m.156532 type:complete len:212 (-) Transcript_71875:128-763(-)